MSATLSCQDKEVVAKTQFLCISQEREKINFLNSFFFKFYICPAYRLLVNVFVNMVVVTKERIVLSVLL